MLPPIYNEEDFCPKCGAYIDVDFDHYSEYDGRPVYATSCNCPREETTQKTNCPERAPKTLATLGDFSKLEK